jgi:hypothetical protein
VENNENRKRQKERTNETWREKVGKKKLRNIAKKRYKGKYGRKEELRNGERDGGERDRSFVKSCLSL